MTSTQLRASLRRLWLCAIVSLLVCASASAQLFERTDPQREVELGRRVAREVEREIPLSRNAALQERVRRIGNTLVKNLPQKAYPYEFKVLASPEVNAFAAPGGFIYFFEGILNRVPDDDALAFIVGHEIAHASHRHYHQTVEKMKGITIAALLASVALNDDTVASIAHGLMQLKYSREHEEDADRTGLEYMWTSGFDLGGAERAAQLLADLDKGNSTPEYLRSHPRGKDRLERIKTLSADLRARPRPAATGDAGPESATEVVRSALGTIPDVLPAVNPYYPLGVGNSWTYEVRSGESRSTYTLCIVAAVPAGAGSVFRAETTLGHGASVTSQLLTTKTALWRRNRPSDAESPWEIESALDTGDEATPAEGFTILPSEPLTVPCGAFTDLRRVRKRTGDRSYNMWYARGVGLVRRECIETGVVETLTAYRVEGVSR